MIYSILATNEPLQEQTFSLFGMTLRFTLRFNNVGTVWNYDLYDVDNEEYICQSFGLAVNAPSLISKNLPFIVMLHDSSGLGINCLDQSEMGNRLKVLFVGKETYFEAVRSAD